MYKVLVVSVLVLVLIGGGLSHATVPHSHGHTHEEGESAIWAALHSSLRHEDKKFLFMLVEATLLFVLTTIAVSVLHRTSRLRRTSSAEEDDMRACYALRSGIYRYRAFG